MNIVKLKELERFGCFKGCSLEQLDSINDTLKPLYIKKDEFVYKEKQKTDKIYFLVSGTLKMLKFPIDHVKPMYLGQLKEGDMFAFGEVFFDEYYISVLATEDSDLLSMNKEDFHELWHDVPSFQHYITHALAHIARGNFYLMERMEAESQMKYLLYYFATQDSKIENEQVILNPPINQIEMAEILNITREHVSRIFKTLKSQGIILQNQPQIILSKEWFTARQLDPDYDESLHRYYRID